MKSLKLFSLFLAIALPFLLHGKDIPVIKYQPEQTIKFEENKNQWNPKILYEAKLTKSGKLFLEKNTFTYLFWNAAEVENLHHPASATPIVNPAIHFFSFKAEFINANANTQVTAESKEEYYKNYYVGNDASKWASNVGIYNDVYYTGLYNLVDMHVYTKDKNLEYDYILKPGANPNSIQVKYTGAQDIFIDKGILNIRTSFGMVTEEKPVAYQIINGIKKEVKCLYNLNGTILSFLFPKGYDKTVDLIIDPVLICSTFSGSNADNWGFTATYDNAGNIYSGGIASAMGYPTTVGAYQTNFGGGGLGGNNYPYDISITKYNASGTALLYSTYLGGSDNEQPASLVVDNTNNLFVLGRTYSANFPVTAGSYDNSYNGGSDIIVSKFNPTGTALLASTFVGGTGDDAVNIGSNFFTISSLKYDYGDDGRGDIMVDNAGNCYVASCTASLNFPTTAGAFQTAFQGGTQDGCVFKMNSTLSALTWSTYLGGNSDDAAYYLDLDAGNNVYVTGGTNSGNFPTTPGTLHTALQGGIADGYVTRIQSNGSGIMQSTYIGTSGYDQSYFVQLDVNQDVYICGTTEGAYPVTPGVYSNPNSGQFIHKMNPTLSATIYSTVFGTGVPHPDISPSAFLVDNCANVYVSGWGGTCIPIGNTGSTVGLPTTANAYQATTDGCDFYFFVLRTNAITLWYASFFGGPATTDEHVDGGTSRFDKNGIIYQSVCAGCGGTSTFPTSPGAWSNTNNSTNCNNAVIKMDFQLINLFAAASAAPNDTVCLGTPVNFTNSSTGAYNYIWDFGDASPSVSVPTPSHTYANPGIYSITLVAIDSNSCNFSDTFLLTITVLPLPVVHLPNDTTICGAFTISLNAGTPGNTYIWNTGATTQTINVSTAGIFSVVMSNGVCSATDTMNIFAVTKPPLGSDTILCTGIPLTLNAGNPGSTYLWSNGMTTQTIGVTASGTYWVVASAGGCSQSDTMNVNFSPVPVVSLGSDTVLCPLEQITLNAQNAGAVYLWNNGSTTQTVTVDTAGTYWVSATLAGCKDADTINISYLFKPSLGMDTTLCDSEHFRLHPQGTLPNCAYLWNTGATTNSIVVDKEGLYWVKVFAGNCVFFDSMKVTGVPNNPALYIPNCFTPDENGLNDTFTAFAKDEDIIEYDMKIFDRWGELLYETTDKNKGWDGTYQNNYVAQNVYVWTVDYHTVCSERTNTHKVGHVMVLR